jgi:hypothetical protein
MGRNEDALAFAGWQRRRGAGGLMGRPMWRARARTREEERAAAVWAGPTVVGCARKVFQISFYLFGSPMLYFSLF